MILFIVMKSVGKSHFTHFLTGEFVYKANFLLTNFDGNYMNSESGFFISPILICRDY